MHEPQEHVSNAVQDIQQHLPAQLKQIHMMMQVMQLHYTAALQPIYQQYGGQGNYVVHNNYRGRVKCCTQRQVN